MAPRGTCCHGFDGPVVPATLTALSCEIGLFVIPAKAGISKRTGSRQARPAEGSRPARPTVPPVGCSGDQPPLPSGRRLRQSRLQRQPARGRARRRGIVGRRPAPHLGVDEPLGMHLRAAAHHPRCRLPGTHLQPRQRAAVRRPPHAGHRTRLPRPISRPTWWSTPPASGRPTCSISPVQ